MRSYNYGDAVSEYDDEEVQVEISFFCEETVRDNEECSTEWTDEFTVYKGEEHKLASECPYCKATNEVSYNHAEAVREAYERNEGWWSLSRD